MPRWEDLTPEQKEYVRELRKAGWTLYDAVIQTACCG